MIRYFLIIFTMVFATQALGQEWAATLGVHKTEADSNVTGTEVDGKLNYKVGALLGFELAEMTKFRTGLIYNQRHLDVTTAAGHKYEYQFSYFDVPANLQYNINDMVGFFGGLVIALNVGDNVEAPAGAPSADADAESMIAILNMGVNLMFNDMIGFDFYYERGMGRFAEGLENHSTFGGSFIYWF
jgi:hypothetical protein